MGGTELQPHWSGPMGNVRRCRGLPGRRRLRIARSSGPKRCCWPVTDREHSDRPTGGVKAATVRAWRARFAEEGLAKLGRSVPGP